MSVFFSHAKLSLGKELRTYAACFLQFITYYYSLVINRLNNKTKYCRQERSLNFSKSKRPIKQDKGFSLIADMKTSMMSTFRSKSFL